MMGEDDDVRPEDAQETDPKLVKRRVRRIRELNDRLRRTGHGGLVVMTAGIAALDEAEIRRVLHAVQTFAAFDADNDPWGEHDCAVLEVDGRRIIWKIDYYDATRQWGSEDPADPAKTCRVLTVMLSSEY